MKIAIVVSQWYWEEITGKMCALSEKTTTDAGCDVVVCKVPGSFEIPWGVQRVIENVDGVVTLGAVIEGETDHDKVISHAIAAKILDLSLHYKKPVVLGVNGPGMTKQQAIERIGRAKEVTESCIEMVLR
jgi:6,7-dimethyl-8-ribityllumazine synthase